MTWNVVGDEVVVLDLLGSVYLKLNGTARVLWELLVEPASEIDLRKALVEGFDVDDDRAQRDVTEFLTQLDERGLLQR